MTLEEAREATQEAAVAAEQIAAHLERLQLSFGAQFPLKASDLASWPDAPRERLHAMLRMFEQLHDLIGRKLFRGFLTLSGEDAASLSAKNLFRRMEALNVIESADRWLELATTRNILVHDYPTNAEKQARSANLAWRDLEDLIRTTERVIGALRQEQLI